MVLYWKLTLDSKKQQVENISSYVNRRANKEIELA